MDVQQEITIQGPQCRQDNLENYITGFTLFLLLALMTLILRKGIGRLQRKK